MDFIKWRAGPLASDYIEQNIIKVAFSVHVAEEGEKMA
jgi:hypothetical protein